MTNTNHMPNKESIGQGIGNFFSGLLGGLAGAGATMRTVINIQSGGKTSIFRITAFSCFNNDTNVFWKLCRNDTACNISFNIIKGRL